MCVAPKIIIFTGSKEKFIEYNKNYQNASNIFYTFGGIATSFNEIKNFLQNDKGIKKVNNPDEIQLTFEYIDSIEKLVLPLFFKALIDNASNEHMEKYTNFLYETYSKEKEQIKELLGSIKPMRNIPIEILSKYYAKLYTCDSNFHKDINKDLGLNKKEKYLPFIKTLYEGVKLKSLPLASNNILYRGSKIANEEIIKIKNYLIKKIENLPGSIVFSKSFLSFSKDINIAKNFLRYENNNPNLSKVLFILEKDDNIGYNLSTHGDIEKISYFPNEKEVLFFPFSSFEIKEIKDINIGKEKGYIIKLLYLGKYLKDIKSNKNIIIKETKIPDSEFKKQLIDFGLINKEKIENINTKKIYDEFNKYEKDVDKNNISGNNKIIGLININNDDINKEIPIINSYENYKKMHKDEIKKEELKFKNEKEIKENTEIKINGKKIDFSYYHKFIKEGTYNIEYIFKNNLTDINHMFYECKNLLNLDLSKFETKNINNMYRMFQDCKSLKKINLSNFNVQNVIDMSRMFEYCESLISLDLSYFNTQKLIYSNFMFYRCKSLKNLNISNFNTQNVINMSYMIYGLESLTNLNLSNFNTQSVTNMNAMFGCCKSLISLDLSNFNTQNVTTMTEMFKECKSLTCLDLSNFNTQNVTNMSGMFKECESLT